MSFARESQESRYDNRLPGRPGQKRSTPIPYSPTTYSESHLPPVGRLAYAGNFIGLPP